MKYKSNAISPSNGLALPPLCFNKVNRPDCAARYALLPPGAVTTFNSGNRAFFSISRIQTASRSACWHQPFLRVHPRLQNRLLHKRGLTNPAGALADRNAVLKRAAGTICWRPVRHRATRPCGGDFGSDTFHGKPVSHSELQAQSNHSDGQIVSRYAHSLKTCISEAAEIPLRRMEGSRFRLWSAWPRYRSLQGLGKSGFSGDSKLQNSAAVLAGMISMEAIKMILVEIARSPGETLD